MYKEIDTYDLIDIMNKKRINLVDIRDSYKFSLGTIKNAKNVPVNFLLTNPDDYLNFDEEYYIFCNYVSTSRKICEILTKKGYRVINILGGYTIYLEDSK